MRNSIIGMKVKTSITLSSDTLAAIDQMAGSDTNRSRVIEEAIIEYIERHRRRVREARDLQIINRSADELNREMEDILEYQVVP